MFYSLLKVKTGVSKTMITTKEWTSIQLNLLKKRQKKIKINQVIRGNARVLNKQVQKLVNDMYRNVNLILKQRENYNNYLVIIKTRPNQSQ